MNSFQLETFQLQTFANNVSYVHSVQTRRIEQVIGQICQISATKKSLRLDWDSPNFIPQDCNKRRNVAKTFKWSYSKNTAWVPSRWILRVTCSCQQADNLTVCGILSVTDFKLLWNVQTWTLLDKLATYRFLFGYSFSLWNWNFFLLNHTNQIDEKNRIDRNWKVMKRFQVEVRNKSTTQLESISSTTKIEF